ncbi:hypothetical protein [Roseibium sp.]|uniref:hypothetical protein n=1 Tax=Roseibium sp. TaxID=1936156 RepID=UPI003266184D
MTHSIRPPVDATRPQVTSHGVDRQAGRHGSQSTMGEKGSSSRDDKGYSRDQKPAFGQHKGADAALSQRSSLFQQKLLETGADRDARERGDGDDPDEGVVLVLLQAGLSSRSSAPGALSASPSRPDVDTRVEQIFKHVTKCLEAAARPGPSIPSASVKINIPLETAGTGLNRIEVTLGDTLVTVKLCLPANAATRDVSEQLLAAAHQLGQSLQAHFPGRRIKILQSSDGADAAPDEGRALVSGPEQSEPLFGLPFRSGRG